MHLTLFQITTTQFISFQLTLRLDLLCFSFQEAPSTLSKRHPYLSSSIRTKHERNLGYFTSPNDLENCPWYREPGQPSRIPNHLFTRLPLAWRERSLEDDSGTFGIQDIRFSGDGRWLAVAAAGRGSSVSPVLVYKVCYLKICNNQKYST